ncbi:MAG: hypothetical protein ABI193_24550 [Minicystis sp.]
MRPLGLAEEGLLMLVTIAGPSHAWGIELRSLLRVESFADFRGATPLHLGAVFAEPEGEVDRPNRVLIISAGATELPVTASGVVALRAVAWDSIHALPRFVIGSPRARFLTGIVFGERGGDPLLIVDVLGLVGSIGSLKNTREESPG